ncbi:MAG TPA: PIG-L family deacetylase [Dehalococcoidales bacterium]|nr:PIG-L family deacetylase [Dehalococcoidales bacterium]
MYQNKTLIFFGAHPDDESFGVGATLAQYAAKGVKTYYVCSTGGEEGTVAPHFLEGFRSIKELREHELKCAVEALGLAGLYYLGYRDSGMYGAASNQHPESLFKAPVDEVAGKMVTIIRELKPDVVITHDAGGGYGHPDHVATHEGAKKAFFAANDPTQYPEAGAPFQPGKLYYPVRTRKLMKFMIKLMPLFGRDPHHFGRNGDIDLTKTTDDNSPVNAIVRLSKQSVETRMKAVRCHPSQSSGTGTRPGLFRMMEFLQKLSGPRDSFMREYPPPNRHREKDLFEGISKD